MSTGMHASGARAIVRRGPASGGSRRERPSPRGARGIALLLLGLLPLTACVLKVELTGHSYASGDVAAASMGLQPHDPWFDRDTATAAPAASPPRAASTEPPLRPAASSAPLAPARGAPLLVTVAPDLPIRGADAFGLIPDASADGPAISPARGRDTVVAANVPAWTHADLEPPRGHRTAPPRRAFVPNPIWIPKAKPLAVLRAFHPTPPVPPPPKPET